MRLMNLVLVVLFLYLTSETISLAMGKSAGLGMLFLPITLGAVFFVSIYMVVMMYRLK